ncbi:GNAT family N-acetyltransferase [Congregibacter sp.]|uniref:GNAT family N-acetyltransferase n=1 Tax=Congregibacter sp. TaxID=2744308 RepID=UPI003F6D2735
MQFTNISQYNSEAIVSLYQGTFTDSEGPAEGSAIASLVRRLLADEARQSIVGFVGAQDQEPLAAIIFSQLTFDDGDAGLLLSPVAVRTDKQKQGIGGSLIKHGLGELKAQGKNVVFTYGDPAYYSRFGFEVLNHEQIIAPYPLSMPQGWQGLSLKGEDVAEVQGRVRCVEAFQDPSLW